MVKWIASLGLTAFLVYDLVLALTDRLTLSVIIYPFVVDYPPVGFLAFFVLGFVSGHLTWGQVVRR